MQSPEPQEDSKSFVIFSGYNFRAVIAFCRFAADSCIPFEIIACGQDDPVFATGFANRVSAVRNDNALSLDELDTILRGIMDRSGLGKLHILPSSEYLNRFFLEHRDRFAEIGVEIPLCGKDLYGRISDKLSFTEMCVSAGLEVPAELDLEDVSTYPVVIKPKAYFSPKGEVQFKPMLIESERQHKEALEKLDLDEIYHQEFVQGASHYLLYFVSSHGNHVRFSQKNLIQQADGGSILAAIPANLHMDPIADQYLDLLVSEGFHGLIMIELRSQGSRHVMIEANPRLWGPSQFFVDMDIPIFAQLAKDLGYSTESSGKTASVSPERYFWNGGMVANAAGGKSIAFHEYDTEAFVREYHLWQKSDVFLRPDSLTFYQQEIHHE